MINNITNEGYELIKFKSLHAACQYITDKGIVHWDLSDLAFEETKETDYLEI